MKAIAVHPGKAGSIHLEDVPKPSVDEVADGRGVLVRVLRVGVDGTDKEINAAEYGAAPEGDDFLIIGHENFGVVEQVGPNVPDTITPGTYVVASVRRPGSSIYGKIGLQDFTTDDVYYERGINLLHGYLTEHYVEDSDYVFPLPETLREVGVLLGKNGVLVLSSITGGERKAEISSDRINQSFVLGNKVMVGTVNAAPADFRSGVDDLIKAQALFPGWLEQLLTTPISGLENYEQMIRALTEDKDEIKVFVEVNGSR